ncbi:hypothetical protein V6R21_06615 [Limibacter armeniacum]|uniref:hypothetical protein n=1 Tax=Limibacter armeniacum TaxID=466084 RepID=UPI002FE5D37E
MKKLILIIGIALMGSMSLMAQDRGPRMTAEERVEKIMENFSKHVTLDETETASVKQVYTEMFAEMEEMRSSGERPDREEMMEKMKQMREEKETKLKEILGEEKFAQYEAAVDEIEPGRRGGGRKGGRR